MGVVPRHYEIEIAPDLDAAVFTGTVAIDVDIVEAVDEIVCNAAELDVSGAWLEVGGSSVELSARLDADRERLTLTRRDHAGDTDETNRRDHAGDTDSGEDTDHAGDTDGTDRCDHAGGFGAGPARLLIRFDGVLNDRLRGFYRSIYTDDSGRTRTIATTQFQSTDARRAFPCFDEPALKATFAVSLVVREGLLAVSNAAETGRERLGDGRVRVSFATTMVMSTYLVAFVVGPLEATEPVDCGGVPVRVIHRPGRGAQTGFALEVAAHALGWFADYYGLSYPSDKLDLGAVPDFAFGAMENLGCVTFREVLLLVDPAAASQPELQRVADVINHELAHMWFGDLVTMAWWEGIWLNEAFATFMETACTDALRPDWQVWSAFCRSRAAALGTDALGATRPVEYPVATPAEAEDMFDVITYEKGAALVRMLEQYLGAEAFRAGVRLYLRRHAYSNTVTADLWDALADASGQPVRRIMESWILQGGYPAVSAVVTDHGLEVSQRHFTLDPDRADDRCWAVPLRLRIQGPADERRELRVLLDQPRHTLTLAAAEPVTAAATADNRASSLHQADLDTQPAATEPVTVTVNSGASGFYRADLGAEALAAVAASGPGDRTAQERHGLVDDAWAFTLAGRLDAAAFLDFVLRGFVAERDLVVWQAIGGSLAHLRRLLDGEAGRRFEEAVAEAAEPAAAELGIDPPEHGAEDDRTRELRATLLRLRGAVAAHPGTVEACRARLDHDDPTLAAAALTVVAAHGDADDFARVKRRRETATDPQTELRHLAALADFGDPGLVLSALGGVLDGTVRSQDGPYLIRRALANRYCGAAAWGFLTGNWEELVAVFPANSLARMLEGITALDRPEQARAVHGFVEAHPVPQGAKQVAQHLERMDVNAALRIRESARLTAAVLSG